MRDFIDEERITSLLEGAVDPKPEKIRDILAKSLSKERLEPKAAARWKTRSCWRKCTSWPGK